jgi:hypothetical protein
MAGKRVGVGDIAKNRSRVDMPEADIFTSTEDVLRPSEPIYKTQSYQLSEEQIGALGLMAATTGRKKNEIVREMFDEALASYIEQFRRLKK